MAARDQRDLGAARLWGLRGDKGLTIIGDEGHERDRLPDDAEHVGGPHYRDSEGGIWTAIPESAGRWAQRGGQYRRRLRRLYERSRHA